MKWNRIELNRIELLFFLKNLFYLLLVCYSVPRQQAICTVKHSLMVQFKVVTAVCCFISECLGLNN